NKVCVLMFIVFFCISLSFFLLLRFDVNSTIVFFSLSLHDALPILLTHAGLPMSEPMAFGLGSGLAFAYLPIVKLSGMPLIAYRIDRKSTRLNFSHVKISYAVFCLKKKKKLSCVIIPYEHQRIINLL